MTGAPSALAGSRLVVAVGLHGSASTWVFNVLRELLIARHGEGAVASLFADGVTQLFEAPGLAGRHVVWKTHHGGPEFEALAWLTGATVILSVRDPRDAVVSLVQRFGVSDEAAMRMLAEDCRRAAQCAATGCALLRYEDGFFNDRATVAGLARLVDAQPSPETLERIFAAYRTEQVRAFAAALDRLPAERRGGGERLPHDKLTQIHRRHIGDGAVGKWRRLLEPARQRELTAFFASFLEAFGYLP